MKRLNRLAILTLLFSVLSYEEVRSEYDTAIGIRAGKFATGPNFKWFFDTSGNTGLDIYGGYTREAKTGYFGRAFVMRQLPILDSRMRIPLDVIFGAGPHLGYFGRNYYRIEDGEAVFYNKKTLTAGISLLFGLEWDTERLPITVGVDLIPYYNLYNRGPEWLDVAISVRYKFR